jgi:peptidyl-prolyl cis-trans isomerase A (cyclophilin A)
MRAKSIHAAVLLLSLGWLACTVESSGPSGKAADKGKAPAGEKAEGVAQAKGDTKNDRIGDGKAEAKADAKAEAKAPVDAKAEQPPAAAPEGAPAGGGEFSKGDMARPGMTPEQVVAYATAQGDPMKGTFTLEDAFGDDAALKDEANGKLHAKFVTTLGEFECELYEDKAPKTVANFVGLARGSRPTYDLKRDDWVKRRYYDKVIFHRVIAGFMLQTGDPTGTGTGTPGRPEKGKPALPGYVIEDEFDKSLKHSSPGILSMANRGPNTGGSQFFVTVAATPHLDGKHAIFGKCDPEVPKKISEVKVDPRANHRPYDKVEIEKIEIFRKK